MKTLRFNFYMVLNKDLPDLIGIQRDSFRRFLLFGLRSELKKLDYICHNNIELFLYIQDLKFKRTKLTPSYALLNSQTYSAMLYVPAQLVYKKRFKSKIDNICFGDVPLMTERGTFVINGSPRVIINQIVRSPGIYYKFEFSKENHRSSVATVIPNAGAWFRIEMDKDGYIWARFNKSKKIPIFVLLQSLGISQKKIFYSVRHPEFLVRSLEKSNPLSTSDALMLLISILKPDKSSTLKESINLVFNNLMNADFYDLGKIGRLKLNKKLHLKASIHQTVLRPEDILAAVNYLINLEYGVGNVDDMDDLKNKRIRSAGELVQNQFKLNLDKVKRTVQYALEKVDSVLDLQFSQGLISNPLDSGYLQSFNFKPLVGSLREFFGSSQLSQFMDETNPLSEITHKRRVSSFGPGGLSREWTGLVVREIHPSHYGRICPIDTPEGQNAGLVGSITTYAKINEFGFMESPFFRVRESLAFFDFKIVMFK